IAIFGVATAAVVRVMLIHAHLAPGVDGVAFALALAGTAVVVREAGQRHATEAGLRATTAEPRWPVSRSIIVGALGGIVLIAIPLAARLPGAPPLEPAARPDAPLPLWIAVTVLVASTEELLFRGVLFAVLARRASPLLAVALTSVAFALVHVPFYGWAAVPV